MKKLLILGAGIMQVPIIQKSRDLGLYTIVADYNPKAPGIKYADKFYCISSNDIDTVLATAREEKIDGVLTTSDAPVRVVATVSKKLGLIAMSEHTADICTNKYLQRKLFRENGINCPFFKLCDESTDLSQFTAYPYIVKPVDSSASRGVKKVINLDELNIGLVDAMNFSNSKKVIIESFITGREFSVETLTQYGKTHIIQITEKLCLGEDNGYFVEDTHIEPARVTTDERYIISQEVQKAIKAIGLDNCPSHTEIKLNEKGACIIEMACRLGGDYITSDLVPLSCGVDMLSNLIKLSIGESIDIEPRINKISCVQFVNNNNYNRCKSFININKKKIFRYEIEPFSDKEIKNSLDRLGYIIMQFNDVESMQNLLKNIK